MLLRAQFVPASVAAAAGLDTLRFRRPSSRLDLYPQPGYQWSFYAGRSQEIDLTETADKVPLRLALAPTWRYVLSEYRRWPHEAADDPRTEERNAYLVDYPFSVAAEARVSDSVAYVRVFPMLPRVPRPDTLYPYLAHQRPFPWRQQRIPLVADQPDTTRHALLRLSFRVLHHSAD